MSDDQSFYEIQLNTPHLVIAFLGAVVVGVAIFWLGVQIGKGQSDTGLPEEWQAAVPADQAPAEAEEEPLEFYETVQEPTSQPQVAAGEPAAAAVDPQTTSEPATTSEPDPPPARVEEAETPVAPTPPASTPASTPSRSTMPAHDPSLATGWVVQVRSTTDKADADALQARLAGDGFPAFVVSADVQSETYYRVRVGRYLSQADARTVESRLQGRSDIESTWVTEG